MPARNNPRCGCTEGRCPRRSRIDIRASIEGRSGFSLPAIGLGTYSLDGIDGTNAVIEAVRAGYRLLDSAFNYENEGAVGAAVRRSGLPRHELIVTSKLPGRHHHFDDALTTIEESVMRMGLDHTCTSFTGLIPSRIITSKRGAPLSKRETAVSFTTLA